MKKVFIKIRLIFSFLFIMSFFNSFAQYIGTSVSSVNSCSGTIIVPVRVSNCFHIGAVSLVLNYNNTLLTFNNYQNAHSQLNNGSLFVNANNGKVIISWASMNCLNITDDTLLKLKFTAITGNSNLIWDTQTQGNCEFSDSLGTVVESFYNNASVTIYQSPSIISNPVNSTINVGQNTNFSVNANGTNLTYQWQESINGGNNWYNLSNSNIYNNVNGNVLYIYNVDLNMNNYQYRCVVSGECLPTVTTNSANLSVNYLPTTIITTAGSSNICPGNVIIPITVQNFINIGSFSLALNYNSSVLSFIGTQNINTALSSGTLTSNANNGKIFISWAQQSGVTISNNEILFELILNGNSGNSDLTFDFQTIGNCEFSNPNGDVISCNYNNGNVSFYQPPVIITNPENRTAIDNQSTNFTVSAIGTNLSYQWQLSTNNGSTWVELNNSGLYSNVNGNILYLNTVSINMNGYKYRCIIDGLCPTSKTSVDAFLTVNPIPQLITLSLANQTICPGTLIVPISVNNFYDVGSFSFVIKYDANILSYVNIQNINSGINGQIVANDSAGSLYISGASSSTSTVNGILAELKFSAITGSTSLNWDIQTNGNCEITDGIGQAIAVVYNDCNISVYQAPTIIIQPVNTNSTEGQNAVFTISTSGSGISYQWQYYHIYLLEWINLTDDAVFSGCNSSSLYVANTNQQMTGLKLRCVVYGTCNPTAISNQVTLNVNPAPQQITVMAQNADLYCSSDIMQPIWVENMNNIGAFSFTMIYDTLILQYKNLEIISPVFSMNDLIVNRNGNKIYISWASSIAKSFGNTVLFNLKFTSIGGSTTNIWDTQTPGNCEISDINGNIISTTFLNGTINLNPIVYFSDLQPTHFAYNEIIYLKNLGIVSGYNCEIKPDYLINRGQLAKIAFLGLFGSNIPLVTDAFPCPFNDLQNSNLYYYRFAKALSYLEYGDGISPFDRNKFNFNPEENITKLMVLKVLLETFNIQPDNSLPSPFTNISSNYPFYGYVKAAADLGIINSGGIFNPSDFPTRAEVFVMLYKIITNNSIIGQLQVNNSLNPFLSDFFIPGNYTPYNFSATLGMEQGNFNHYTKSSFDIPGRGFPLNFGHSYNSFLTELPDQFFTINPLGRGWSHTYNSYIINTDEVKDSYGNSIGKPCFLVFWQDGTMNVYDNENNPTNPKTITYGVYDKLTKVSSTELTIKTKSQITYTYSKINGSASSSPYVLTQISDRNNNLSTITYEVGVDTLPRIKKVTDAVGRKLNFFYSSGTNLINKITDPINREIKFDYTNGKLSSFEDAKNQHTYYYYDTLPKNENLLDSIRLPKGNVITNVYQQRKLVSTKFNNNSPTTIDHTPNYTSGNDDFYKSTVKTPQQNGQSITTNYNFNKTGGITSINGNPATDFSLQYNEISNPLLANTINNNKNGVTVNITYDSIGNLLQTTLKGGSFTSIEKFEYNSRNDITKHINANNNQTAYEYDNNGNLIKVTNPLNKITTITYNNYGQIESVTNPLQNKVIYAYNDTVGLQNKTIILALNLSSSVNYDLASRILSKTNFKGQTNTYQYDNNDNLLKEFDALNHLTQYAYDSNDNLKAITNAKGRITSFNYDFDNDWLLSESFEGFTKEYTYNYDGSLKTLKDPNANIFNYTYDFAGRVLNDGYATYTYNNNGNIETITKNNKSVTLVYDALNRLSSSTYDGMTVSYEYDNVGNVTAIIYPGNKRVSYTYDANNNMKTVKDWNNKITTYNYRDDGSLLHIIYPNMVNTTYAYDTAGRQIGMITKRMNGSIIAEQTYVLDAIGNHTEENMNLPLVSYPNMNKPLINYTYNNANRIISADSTMFNFDYNGNTTSKTGYNYTYDLKNNLIAVSGNFTANYTYDGAGLRREASYNGSIKKFVLSMIGMENVLIETDVNNNPINYYIYGLGLISRIKPDNNTSYYVYDFRGSTIAIVDSTQNANITHKYAYDDFGAVIKAEETDFNPFRYVGQYGVMYETSDLFFMRARYYDNSIGRFLSEDPIWSTNLYPYADNNPITYYDPNGLAKFLVRPLDGAIGYFPMEGPIFNELNIETVHEHIFFKDGTNIGWEQNGLFTNEKESNYHKPWNAKEIEYDDVALKFAVLMVAKTYANVAYSLTGEWGIFGKPITDETKNFMGKFNCQDFADEVRKAYKQTYKLYKNSKNKKRFESYINNQFKDLLKSIK